MEDQGPVKVAGLPHLTGLHLSAEGATHTLAASARRRQGKRSLTRPCPKGLARGAWPSQKWRIAMIGIVRLSVVTGY